MNNTFKNGFADALKLFYEEHGCYPPLPDLSKPRLVLEEGPRAVWSGAMSEDVTAKIREYATDYINLHETEMTKVLETPGREKVIEFLTNRWAQLGLADALEKHYAEHGCYPDFADLTKFNLRIVFGDQVERNTKLGSFIYERLGDCLASVKVKVIYEYLQSIQTLENLARDSHPFRWTNSGALSMAAESGSSNSFSKRRRICVDGFAPVKIDDKWGFIGLGGNRISNPQFDPNHVLCSRAACGLESRGIHVSLHGRTLSRESIGRANGENRSCHEG